jgi:hypothetical protein
MLLLPLVNQIPATGLAFPSEIKDIFDINPLFDASAYLFKALSLNIYGVVMAA